MQMKVSHHNEGGFHHNGKRAETIKKCPEFDEPIGTGDSDLVRPANPLL